MTFNIREDQFGFFSGINLVLSDTMLVTATFDMGYKTYELVDEPMSTGGAVYKLLYPDSFYISGDPILSDTSDDTLYRADIPEIRTIFDATAALRIQGYPEDGVIDHQYGQWGSPDSLISAYIGVTAVPYIGDKEPIISRYTITWQDNTDHYLRLLTIELEDGQIPAVSLEPIYTSDYRHRTMVDNGYIELDYFCWQKVTINKNKDGSWWIGDDPVWWENNPDEVFGDQMYFPAFRTEDHSGELVIKNDTTLTYTAEKL